MSSHIAVPAIPRRKQVIAVHVTVTVGDQVITVTDRRPLVLSGARRLWPKQIRDLIANQADFLATRFGGEALANAERSDT